MEKKSPLKRTPPRNPGQSLTEKVYDLLYGEILIKVIIILILLSVVVQEWWSYYYPTPSYPRFWTTVFILVSIVLSYLIRKNYIELKRYKLGRAGEQTVGHYLEEFRTMGYKVFHDIDTGKGNIDHALVGPAGVFVIDTKTNSKRPGDVHVKYDGNSVVIDGFENDDIVPQLKGEKFWLDKKLQEWLKEEFFVRPVVLFPGWFVEGHSLTNELWVVNPKRFKKEIAKSNSILSMEQIERIAKAIEAYQSRAQ